VICSLLRKTERHVGKRRMNPQERVAALQRCTYADGPLPSEERLDPAELVNILREAAGAKNKWKRILGRCAPPKRTARRAVQ